MSKAIFFRLLSLASLFVIYASVPAAFPSTQIHCATRFAELKEFRYPKALDELDPEAPHTIKDMRNYLFSKLGKEPVELAKNPQIKFTIVKGPGEEFLRHLQLAADETAHPVDNPFGAFNLVKVTGPNRPPHFYITNVNGESRYLQVLSFLKLAGVQERQIQSFGNLSSYREIYLDTFQRIGHKPDLVVFGFANTALQDFAERSPSANTSEILRRNLEYTAGKWNKPVYRQHELSRMGVQVLELQNGKHIWFIDNEYGDRAVEQIGRAHV